MMVMDEGDQRVAVERIDEQTRYEIRVEGLSAGFSLYRDREYRDRVNQRIFYHTVVDGAFAGHGLGSNLVESALSDTRSEGMRVVPVCPFIAAYLKSHHDFDDIVDPVQPEIVTWLESQL
jgi:predicted GNAT family acetyltransferase